MGLKRLLLGLLGVLLTTSVGLSLAIVPAQAADPIVNVAPPSVSGVTQYRQTLTANPGQWTPAGLTYTYQWLRDGAPISGASAASYGLQLDDLDHRISVRVVASDGTSLVAADSVETSAIAKANLVNQRAPEVAGKARYSRLVEATRGEWSVKPDQLKYQWLRSGRVIAGATQSSYRLVAGDFGQRISVVETAIREGYRRGEAASAAVKVKHRVGVKRTVTYHVETRGRISTSLETFKQQAQETYDDPRGWRAQGVKFRRVARGGNFTLVLSEASRVTSFSSSCSATWSCRVGRFVIINQTRWKHASPAWNSYGRSGRDYRHMVVNHETGHWLGRGHLGCPGPGRKAPVMMQQSKGLAGCRANPWPAKSELRGGRGASRLAPSPGLVVAE